MPKQLQINLVNFTPTQIQFMCKVLNNFNNSALPPVTPNTVQHVALQHAIKIVNKAVKQPNILTNYINGVQLAQQVYTLLLNQTPPKHIQANQQALNYWGHIPKATATTLYMFLGKKYTNSALCAVYSKVHAQFISNVCKLPATFLAQLPPVQLHGALQVGLHLISSGANICKPTCTPYCMCYNNSKKALMVFLLNN